MAALVSTLLECVAAVEDDAELAVLRPDPIGGRERRRAPHRLRLFAAVGKVEGEPALPLRVVEDAVKLVDVDHRLHHLDARLLIQVRKLGTPEWYPFVVDHPVSGHHRRQRVAERIEILELRDELASRRSHKVADFWLRLHGSGAQAPRELHS